MLMIIDISSQKNILKFIYRREKIANRHQYDMGRREEKLNVAKEEEEIFFALNEVGCKAF